MSVSDLFELFLRFTTLSLLAIGGAITLTPEMHRFTVVVGGRGRHHHRHPAAGGDRRARRLPLDGTAECAALGACLPHGHGADHDLLRVSGCAGTRWGRGRSTQGLGPSTPVTRICAFGNFSPSMFMKGMVPPSPIQAAGPEAGLRRVVERGRATARVGPARSSPWRPNGRPRSGPSRCTAGRSRASRFSAAAAFGPSTVGGSRSESLSVVLGRSTLPASRSTAGRRRPSPTAPAARCGSGWPRPGRSSRASHAKREAVDRGRAADPGELLPDRFAQDRAAAFACSSRSAGSRRAARGQQHAGARRRRAVQQLAGDAERRGHEPLASPECTPSSRISTSAPRRPGRAARSSPTAGRSCRSPSRGPPPAARRPCAARAASRYAGRSGAAALLAGLDQPDAARARHLRASSAWITVRAA
jgi:hypothetical protein